MLNIANSSLLSLVIAGIFNLNTAASANDINAFFQDQIPFSPRVAAKLMSAAGCLSPLETQTFPSRFVMVYGCGLEQSRGMPNSMHLILSNGPSKDESSPATPAPFLNFGWKDREGISTSSREKEIAKKDLAGILDGVGVHDPNSIIKAFFASVPGHIHRQIRLARPGMAIFLSLNHSDEYTWRRIRLMSSGIRDPSIAFSSSNFFSGAP